MGLIEIDFVKARKQADRLYDLADELETLKDNDYAPTMEKIRSSWTGESANLYINKGAQLEGEIEDTINMIKRVADNIRDTVKKIEDAQRAAQEVIAEKNT